MLVPGWVTTWGTVLQMHTLFAESLMPRDLLRLSCIKNLKCHKCKFKILFLCHINRLQVRLTDKKLDLINGGKTKSSDQILNQTIKKWKKICQKLDQQVEKYTNKSNIRATFKRFFLSLYQNLDQPITSKKNRSSNKSTDQKIDQQSSYRN